MKSPYHHAIAEQDRRVHVLIAHPEAIVRAGLATLLATQSDLHVAIAAADGAASHADIIILDHRGAIDRVARRAAGDPAFSQARVLAVTTLDREWEVYTALTAGVDGYLLQNADGKQLLEAVRTLSRGVRYLSGELTRCVADSFSRTVPTSRQMDVLQLLAQGQCNKSIARELGIGVGTVKTHVKSLCEKLGATARTHAVVLATQRGLVGKT